LFSDKVRFLLLKLWLFFSDQNTKKLVSKTLFGDHEVKDGNLGRYLRKVMRVSKLCAHEEDKVIVILKS